MEMYSWIVVVCIGNSIFLPDVVFSQYNTSRGTFEGFRATFVIPKVWNVSYDLKCPSGEIVLHDSNDTCYGSKLIYTRNSSSCILDVFNASANMDGLYELRSNIGVINVIVTVFNIFCSADYIRDENGGKYDYMISCLMSQQFTDFEWLENGKSVGELNRMSYGYGVMDHKNSSNGHDNMMHLRRFMISPVPNGANRTLEYSVSYRYDSTNTTVIKLNGVLNISVVPIILYEGDELKLTCENRNDVWIVKLRGEIVWHPYKKNNSLYISKVTRGDIGYYKCSFDDYDKILYLNVINRPLQIKSSSYHHVPFIISVLVWILVVILVLIICIFERKKILKYLSLLKSKL